MTEQASVPPALPPVTLTPLPPLLDRIEARRPKVFELIDSCDVTLYVRVPANNRVFIERPCSLFAKAPPSLLAYGGVYSFGDIHGNRDDRHQRVHSSHSQKIYPVPSIAYLALDSADAKTLLDRGAIDACRFPCGLEPVGASDSIDATFRRCWPFFGQFFTAKLPPRRTDGPADNAWIPVAPKLLEHNPDPDAQIRLTIDKTNVLLGVTASTPSWLLDPEYSPDGRDPFRLQETSPAAFWLIQAARHFVGSEGKLTGSVKRIAEWLYAESPWKEGQKPWTAEVMKQIRKIINPSATGSHPDDIRVDQLSHGERMAVETYGHISYRTAVVVHFAKQWARNYRANYKVQRAKENARADISLQHSVAFFQAIADFGIHDKGEARAIATLATYPDKLDRAVKALNTVYPSGKRQEAK